MKQVSVTFWLRTAKSDQSPVYCKIYYDRARADFPTGIRVSPASWKDGRVTGKGEDVEIANATLGSISYRAMSIANRLLAQGEPISADIIKAELIGRTKAHRTLSEVIKATLDEKVDMGMSPATIKQYEGLLNSMDLFVKDTYGTSDVYLHHISSQSREEHYIGTHYQIWLKKRGLEDSTIHKNLALAHSAMLLAIKRGWISSSPFAGVKRGTKKKDHIWLSEEELSLIENFQTGDHHLEMARDLFLFCCYTGMAWIDATQFVHNHIIRDVENMHWIFISRQKTRRSSAKKCKIPLVEKAEVIVDKYTKGDESLFAGISYANYLFWLGKIAQLTGIVKRLTTHVGRHTFAVHMLDKGFSFDAVAEMLGHANSAMVRQIYGEITPKRISMEYHRIESGSPHLLKISH